MTETPAPSTYDRDYWLKRSRALLEANRVEVRGHRYTRPAPSTYEHQWLWDSCFHAIILRHFDLEMAHDELLSVIAHQVKDGSDAGMIPHMTYWNGGGAELWGRDDRSIITQPPLIAVAAMLVYEKTDDKNKGKALLQRLYEPLAAYHEWFDRRRDPDNDNLVALIHPWETGWDSLQRWDKPMYLSADPTDDEARLARKNLVVKLIEYDCDAVKLAEAGYFHVETCDFNAIRAADLENLSKIAAILGKPDDAEKYRQQCAAVRQAITEKLVRDGKVCDLAGLDEKPIDEPAANEFVALFGGAIQKQSQEIIRRLQTPENWPIYPIPTCPTNAPLYVGNRYWRGNTWLQVNWLVWNALKDYGYSELAHDLTRRSLALVEKHDFHEYFNPLTGEGHGSFPHSWSAIVLDMLLTDGLSQ